MDRSSNRGLVRFALVLAALVLFGFKGGDCRGSGGTPDDSEEPGETSPDGRPQPGCPGVVCNLWCEFGNATDAAGCPLCACNDAPVDPCNGLDERSCNATPGCLGLYGAGGSGDPGCACSPCPPGVRCDCNCPTRPSDGAFDACVPDWSSDCRPQPHPRPDPVECMTDADCPRGGICLGQGGNDTDCRPNADGSCRPQANTPGYCAPSQPRSHHECRTDADCRPGGVCEHLATCAAIGCPPPGSICVYPDGSGSGGETGICDGAHTARDGSCRNANGRELNPRCCGVAVDPCDGAQPARDGSCVSPDGSLVNPRCCLPR